MQLENDFKALKEKSASAENQAGSSSSCSDTSVALSASRGVDNVAAIGENNVATKESLVSVKSQDANVKQEPGNGDVQKAVPMEEEICAKSSETQKTVFVIAESDLQVNAT